MKNIHVLPTDKPSRLAKSTKTGLNATKKGIGLYESGKFGITTFNIYITNDEEIKEGDWFICLEHSIEDFKFNSEIAQRLISKQNKELFEGWINGITISDIIGDRLQGNYQIEHCKKIILTTDQDLIKDGVQAIDDEFLEWFVKNPSCEEVEVEKTAPIRPFGILYKIIIPNIEHKGKALSEQEVMDNRSSAYDYIDFDKQETLEEAAKIESKYLSDWEDKQTWIDGFIEGAKWQQEQDKNKYSEEDMIKAIQLARLCTLDKEIGDFVDLSGLTEICTYGLEETHSENSIIKQFKNK